MLTVKHIATDGTESIMEAELVERVQTGDRFMDGIYLDRTPANELGADLGQIQPGRSHKHCIRFAEARSSTDCDPRVYVMNRFGATVATYRL